MSKGAEIGLLIGIAVALLLAFFIWGIVWHSEKQKKPGAETDISWKHALLHNEYQPALLFLVVMFLCLSVAVNIWA